MRDESQCVPLVQNSDASGGKDRAAEYGRHLAGQMEADNPSAVPGATLGQSEAGAAKSRTTPGWDQRPGADSPYFDRLAYGWISKTRAVAPESATLALCIVAVAIVTAFGLGWFCGSTWYSSRTAGAKILSRTVSVPLHGASGKRSGMITGSIAGPVSRSLGTSAAESRKAPFIAAEMSAAAPSITSAEQHITTSQAPGAPPGDMNSGPRPTPFPETRPATIDGWTVRDVYGGTAELVGPDRTWTVRPGDYVPGVGRVDSITRWGSRWIVVTSSGLISTQ
jgi:hypothetical protein